MQKSIQTLAFIGFAATLAACSSIAPAKTDPRSEQEKQLDSLAEQDPKAIQIAFSTSFDRVLSAVGQALSSSVESASSGAPAYAPLAAPAPEGGSINQTQDLNGGGSLTLQGSYSATPGASGATILEFSLVASWADVPVTLATGSVMSSGHSTLRGSITISSSGGAGDGTFVWQGTHMIGDLSLPFDLAITVEGNSVVLGGTINGETLSFDLGEFSNDAGTDEGGNNEGQDTEAPETMIGNAPEGSTAGTSVELELTCDDDAGCTFECKVDFGQFESCESPLVLTDLIHGSHTVTVRASDNADNVDQTPAVATWQVAIDSLAPETTLIGGPSGIVATHNATIGFSCNEESCTFECSLDGADFASCSSPVSFDGLKVGAHTLAVRATDGSNNLDVSPAQRAWVIQNPNRAQWIDADDNIYVADTYNCAVRKIAHDTGVITTVAGTGNNCDFTGDGGPATAATLRSPTAVALDLAGNLYIADTANNRIRKVDAMTGVISTIAGNGMDEQYTDNTQATNSAINGPYGLFVDADGDVYIGVHYAGLVVRVDSTTGLIHRIAGNNFARMVGNGDGGPALEAYLGGANGVVVDSADNVYVSEGWNLTIRKIDGTTGIISAYAGTGDWGMDNGWLANASAIGYPAGLCVLGNGDLLFANSSNSAIRKISANTGILSTVAGTLDYWDFGGDGGPATAAYLAGPGAVNVDSDGNMVIMDTYNQRVRQVNATTNVITTIAGTGNFGFSGDDGQATDADLAYPGGVYANDD